MSFTAPWALITLLAIPFTIWLGMPRRGSARERRDWTSLALRSIILLLLTLSLAGAQTVRTVDELAVIFLVDGSDSITNSQAETAETFVRDAIATMGPNDSSAVVVFGANALVDRPISGVAELTEISSVPQTLHTDLAEAIRLGLALFPAGTARRMVILSDGAATIGDTDAAARLAQANGVEISYVPLLRDEASREAFLTSVNTPSRVAEGEIFNIDITAESTTDTAGTLRVIAEGQIVAEQDVQLRPGTNNYSIRLQAEEQQFSRYVVQLEADTDTLYQNNQLAAYTEITGPPRVLIVSPDGTLNDEGESYPEEAIALESALIQSGLVVERTTPFDLPSNFAELSNYSTIVLANVNAKYLSPRKMEALATYTRDLGGGLVAVGGPEAFGMGGWFRTPIEAALPVKMQIEDEERFPAVSMVIVIDRSGSMGIQEGSLTKIQLAAEGAVRVVELLNDFDDITVIPVDTAPNNPIGPLPASQRGQAIQQIRRIGAGGGGIFVYSGLKAAQDALSGSTNQVRHIILLADGSDSEEKSGVPELIDEMTAEGITLTTVSIGNGADMAWLQQMAERGNGRFHFTDRAANLPQIFTQETTTIQRSYLVEEEFFPKLGRQSPILSGIRQTPPLSGYVGTSPKNTAQVVLETHLNDPLLATWQYGLGRSAAWTSDATGRWGTRWVEWEGFPVFWAQTVRWTISESRNSTIETVVDFSGEDALLTVDARTPGGDYLNGLEMEGSVVSPSGETTEVQLQQIAPGRYETNFVPDEEGAYFLRVAGGDAETDTAIGQTGGWVLGYSPEYQRFDSDPQLLESLAQLTGGRDLGEVTEAVFEHNLPSDATTRPIWPFLLLLAVILLPIDVAIRRVVISQRDMQRLREATLGRFGRQETVAAPRTEGMSSLLRAKERAADNQAQDSGLAGRLKNLRESQSGRTVEPRTIERPSITNIERPEPPLREESKQEQGPESSLASKLLKKKREQGKE
ncbi:MAG: VWA domain-containing protein [Chloroflexota bacterium]